MTSAGRCGMLRLLVLLGCACVAPAMQAHAHSASDAYLTLTSGPSTAGGGRIFHGQWDIALRDLDFLLRLDDDGDGRVTWKEVRRHQSAIERYAYSHLRFGADPGSTCSITPRRQLIDDHADGAYAALLFDASCVKTPRKLTLDYSLFFAVDPSHRGILILRNGDAVATAVLSPANSRIDLIR